MFETHGSIKLIPKHLASGGQQFLDDCLGCGKEETCRLDSNIAEVVDDLGPCLETTSRRLVQSTFECENVADADGPSKSQFHLGGDSPFATDEDARIAHHLVESGRRDAAMQKVGKSLVCCFRAKCRAHNVVISTNIDEVDACCVVVAAAEALSIGSRDHVVSRGGCGDVAQLLAPLHSSMSTTEHPPASSHPSQARGFVIASTNAGCTRSSTISSRSSVA